jgi:hypothetical protein
MTTAERIVIGIASLIALIGWLRWLGVAGSRNADELRNQRPTGPTKYQRPSNGQISEPPTITHSNSKGAKVLQVLSPDEVAGLGIIPDCVGDLAGAENAFADASADRITEAPMKAHRH